ncbi:MAG: PAS domain S-box protein [Lentisphaeria bacterium]|nr:PAS domain S-box protein [Lentisphaeria bacterium]
MVFQIVIALLELVFIFVILAALCHQRDRIGVSPLIMAFATFLCFGTLMSAAEVYLPLPFGIELNVPQTVIFLPMLAAFLMVYLTAGVLKAQQLLLGTVSSFLLYLYLGMLIKVQCSAIPHGALRDIIFILLADGTASVNLSAVSNLIAFFTVPVIYTLFPARLWRTVRIILALLLAQTFGTIPEAVLLWLNGSISAFPLPSFLVQLALTPLTGSILSFYLALLQRDLPDNNRRSLDFIFAFFGSYGRVKELESDLTNWANRYHLVLRHTAEAVMITDDHGIIQEANIAASRLLGSRGTTSLIGKNMFDFFHSPDPPDTRWEDAGTEPIYFNCIINPGKNEKTISASLSPIRLRNQLLLVLVGRDITEEIKLEREKEELSEQLMHSQRMESLGVLAGGIAHDFNNCIHAIMGHADVAAMLYAGNPEKVTSHLQKITSIAEKAGKLTSQLLGFARKGKYNVVEIDLKQLLDECTGLLDPYRVRGVDFTNEYAPEKLIIKGDQIQMQQVVLNLLINALDATSGNEGERKITLLAGRAADAPCRFAPIPDFAGAKEEDYLYFAIADNGSGMDEETRKKIFEPFFTTKPVGSGTGMGLAMVYGTVTHHRGWIQLRSAPGKGTTFCFFLPDAAIM